jgi:hypothetical protein
MNSSNLEAWSVASSDFPAAGTVTDKARFAVRYAILVPLATTPAVAVRQWRP